jgi:hypothetical protein
VLLEFCFWNWLQGSFSFDDFFKRLVGDVVPSLSDPEQEDEQESNKGTTKPPPLGPTFSEAEKLIPIFRDSRKELLEISSEVITSTAFYVYRTK